MNLSVFVNQFNKLAPQYHRYQVFNDFVVMSAIAIHNSIQAWRRDDLESEYQVIRAKYNDDEYKGFGDLFYTVVELLDAEPRDVLGELYMTMGLGNTQQAQYFTPHSVNRLTAGLAQCDISRPFHSVSEPSCGSGGLILAYVNQLIKAGINPVEKMLVHAQDIDRVAALMCYIQLSLWNVPARIVVGDTLLNESREYFLTPAFTSNGLDDELITQHPETPVAEFNGGQYVLFS